MEELCTISKEEALKRLKGKIELKTAENNGYFMIGSNAKQNSKEYKDFILNVLKDLHEIEKSHKLHADEIAKALNVAEHYAYRYRQISRRSYLMQLLESYEWTHSQIIKLLKLSDGQIKKAIAAGEINNSMTMQELGDIADIISPPKLKGRDSRNKRNCAYWDRKTNFCNSKLSTCTGSSKCKCYVEK